MRGVLPTVESGKPVKQQVEGLLAFAEALHRHPRQDAKCRARRWSRAAHAQDTEDGTSPRHSILPAQGETSREVQPRGGSDEDLPTGRVDSDGSSEELARKKGPGRNLPKLSPSIRANKLRLAEEILGDEDLSLADAQVLVETYRKRNRAAEAAVQASVERFHRGRKQQEPLLDDLKTLKKVIADKNRHAHLLEGLGIRQFIKHKANHWEDGNTRGSSRSSARTPPEWQPISKKSGDERRPSFTRSREVDVWSLRTNSKDSTGRRQAEVEADAELSPEEEEQLLAMAEDLASKELAQSLRLRRSPMGMRPKGVEQKNTDWLHGLQRKKRNSGAAHDLTLQVPRHRLQRAPRCLQPLSEKDLAARRIGNVVFWHSSAWPSSLRRVAKAREGHATALEEVPPSLHPFVIGEHKQVDEVRTLRLEEAEPPLSSSSSSSSSVSPKEKLAKSCLKPWRSPVEAYLGKSFIFPQRRGSARASELLGASVQKSASQRTLEKGPVAPAVEEAEATATSRTAWEKIKRTHGFAALCHAHPRNDR